MRIIGLTGVAGSGKDTAANILLAEDTLGTVVRQGFADKLKLSAAQLFIPGCDMEEAIKFCNWLKLEGSVKVNGDLISGRQFLQRYGTEAHRNVFGTDFWLDAVLPEGRDDCDLLVIPDVRFANEADRVVDRGGEVWMLHRPNAPPVEDHESELRLNDEQISSVVDNSGHLGDLRRQIIQSLLGRKDQQEGLKSDGQVLHA